MTLPIIQRRRIEAELLSHVYGSAAKLVGKEQAKAIIREAVQHSAIEQARHFAAAEPGGTSLQSFIDIQKHWTAEDALEIDYGKRDDTHFEFKVTRCRYAEMYKDMGLDEIGPLLSCNRDGSFCQGYDPKLKFSRTQTIMEGAPFCDFSYRYEKEAGEG